MPREQKTKQNMQSFSKQPGLRNRTQRSPTKGSWCWISPSWCQQWHQLQLRNSPAFLMAHGAMTQSGEHVARNISASWSDESDMIYSMPKATISSKHLYVLPFPFYAFLSNSDQVQVKQIELQNHTHSHFSSIFKWLFELFSKIRRRQSCKQVLLSLCRSMLSLPLSLKSRLSFHPFQAYSLENDW